MLISSVSVELEITKIKFKKKREKLLLQKREQGKSFSKVRRNLIERMSMFLLPEGVLCSFAIANCWLKRPRQNKVVFKL